MVLEIGIKIDEWGVCFWWFMEVMGAMRKIAKLG
jgi:hypothetical protein